MKKLLLLISLFSIYQANAQQNLVLNPSFEENHLPLPCLNNTNWSNPFPLTHWSPGAHVTPDVRTTLTPDGCFSRFLYTNVLPRTGTNCIGVSSGITSITFDTFEYFRGKLSEDLIVGLPYRVEFYVTKSEQSKGTNNLGIKFITADQPIYPIYGIISLQPDVNYSGPPIFQSPEWTLISFYFTPTQPNLREFVVGRFFPIAQTLIYNDSTTVNESSYFFFDDFAVYLDDPIFEIPDEICFGDQIILPSVSINGVTGRWSPEFNNQETTTYIFTPDIDVISSVELTIIVKPNLIPEFDEIGPFCDEVPNFTILPTISNNGIQGTWSPAFNPNNTNTYTFVPDDSLCNQIVTKTIIIDREPIFDSIGPVCQLDTNYSLPTISSNGISGTWSPIFDLNNSQTYTFTRDSGDCTQEIFLDVIVIPRLTIEFDEIGPFCDEFPTFTSLPSISNNGVEGTWSPVFNPNETGVYTFTPNEGICAEVITKTIIIDKTPIFDSIGPICQLDTNFRLPTISSNGISGTWLPEFNFNQSQSYTFTRDSGDCIQQVTLDVVIKPSTKPIFDEIGPFCDEVPNISALPTISNNGIEGVWTPVFNPNQTEVYTFTPNEDFCAEVVTMKVIIDKTPTFDEIEPFCEIDENFSLPTISTNGISGTWAPAFDPYNSQTYTFTRDFGDCTQQVTLDVVINSQLNFTLSSYCNEGEYFVDIITNNFSISEIKDVKWTINNTLASEIGSKLNLSNYLNLLQEINTIEVIFTDSNGCLHATEVYVLGEYLCKIQKGISPNGDGLNEYFDLVSFGGVDLKIFNRYGSVVYENSNYTNDWKGQSNSGKKLPTGTYFYVIKTRIGEQFSGYIQLTY